MDLATFYEIIQLAKKSLPEKIEGSFIVTHPGMVSMERPVQFNKGFTRPAPFPGDKSNLTSSGGNVNFKTSFVVGGADRSAVGVLDFNKNISLLPWDP